MFNNSEKYISQSVSWVEEGGHTNLHLLPEYILPFGQIYLTMQTSIFNYWTNISNNFEIYM